MNFDYTVTVTRKVPGGGKVEAHGYLPDCDDVVSAVIRWDHAKDSPVVIDSGGMKSVAFLGSPVIGFEDVGLIQRAIDKYFGD